ncbi:MAG: hypothetical protein IPM97_03480 [Bdellovibrionaceae bacterium]|nr:hypothetical protein [Pseudobdellovibrionaceae bacterium]
MKMLTLLLVLFNFLSAWGSASTNPVKSRLKSGETAMGGYISIADSKVVENVALPKKLDFIWIEALQNDIGPREVQSLVIAAENENLVPIVRVPKNDRDEIKKYLGTGVMGVVIPGVKNREDALNAVAALKYAPEGNRPPGVDRATRYMGRIKEYMANANQNMLVILTVDNEDFVRNLESILSVQGIDVIHVGPLHLSSSMGLSIDAKEVKQAIEKVEIAAKNKGIPLGGANAKYTQLNTLKKKGYRFLTVPGDMELLRHGVESFFSAP